MTNSSNKRGVSPVKDETMDDLQARIAELEQENARLQTELAASDEHEESLREAENLYRTIAHFAYDWVYWEAPDGSLRYVSPSCERITGYTSAEFMADPDLFASMIVPEDHVIWAEHWHRRDRAQEQDIQFRIRCRNGDIRWLEHICQPIVGDDGTFDGFRAANRDISYRKQAEAELQKSKALLTESQRIAHLGHWDWNIKTGELSWSDEIYRIFGLQPQEFGATYDAFMQLVYSDDRHLVQQAVNEAVNREKPYSIDHRIVWPDGTERVVHEQGEVTFNDDGRPIRMLGIVQDITERVKIEEELRASQIRFANILDIALEAIISVDESHRIILFNRGAEQIFGYTADEVKGQLLEILLPERFRDSHEKHMSVFAYASISARRMAERIEIFGRRKNGKEFPAEASISKLRIGKENIFTVILRDISLRIQAEQELAQYREHLEELVTARTNELTRTNKMLEKEIAERIRVEERLKEQDYIINKSPVMVFLWRNDEGWPVEFVSSNIHEFGYIPQDFYTERVRFADIVHPDDLEHLAAEVAEYSRDGRSGFLQEYRIITHGGEVRWVEDRTWIRRDENNEITHFQGVVYDITARKEAEIALQESEETTRALLNASTDHAVLVDPDGTIVALNQIQAIGLGYSTDELIGQNVFNFFPPDVAESRRSRGQEVATTGRPVRFEDVRAGRWYDNHLYPVFDTQGQVRRIAVYARDITEIRQAEESLRESEAKFRNLAEQSPNMIFINQKGRVVYANQQCVDLTGYSRREFYADEFDLFSLIAPENVDLVKANFAKHLQGEDVAPYEYRLITKTGRWIEAINTSKLVRYGGETAILGIVTDITERKQAELAIRRANDELQQHVEELSTLNLIAQTVTTITDLDTVLGVVAGILSQLFNAYGTDISLLNGKEARLTVFVRHNEDGTSERRKDPIVPLSDNPAARRVIETAQPLLVLKAPTNPLVEPIHKILQAQNVQSLMSVPMLSRGKTIGLVTIYTNQPNRDFTPVEVGLAETIAGQVAGAVETARLFGEEQERRQEAERRRLIAESLGDILAVLNANQPLDDTLDYISTQANQLLGTDANAIYRQEEAHDDPFTVLAAQGYYAEEINAVELPLGHSVLAEALSNGQPLAISDLSGVPVGDAFETELSAFTKTKLAKLIEEFKALLAIPLFVRDEPYGGIILYYRQPREFTAEEIALAVIFSTQVTLAIENANLRLQAERSAVAAERNRLARDLHDSVTQTLFSVAAIAEALPRVWESHPTESKKALDELRRLTQGALAEMRNLLLELRPAVLVEKPMSELLRQLADAMMGRTRMQVTTTVVDERVLSPEVKIGLYRIAQESLNNVTKHARASQVKIGLYYEPEQVELNIIDNGLGFDPDTIAPGQLGVSIMAERAAAIGATFNIESQSDQGTRITVVWSDS